MDPVLGTYLSRAESSDDFRPAVTLFLPGGIVTGSVTSTNQRFRELAASYQAVQEGEAVGQVESEAEESPPTYIHLADARYLVGGPAPWLPAAVGALFRARLSDVDGWALGTPE